MGLLMKLASPLIRRMFNASPEDLAVTVEQGVLEFSTHAYHVSAQRARAGECVVWLRQRRRRALGVVEVRVRFPAHLSFVFRLPQRRADAVARALTASPSSVLCTRSTSHSHQASDRSRECFCVCVARWCLAGVHPFPHLHERTTRR